MPKLSQLATVMVRTYYILERFPDARNDDKVLTAEYMEHVHGITTYKEAIGRHDIPQAKSIERCRRFIQRKFSALRPDSETAKARRKCESEYHLYARACGQNTLPGMKRIRLVITKAGREAIERKWIKEFMNGTQTDESTDGADH